MWRKITSSLSEVTWRGNIYKALVLYLVLAMVMYSLSRLVFYFFNTTYFPGMSITRMSHILLGGMKFDMAAVLYSNVGLLLMLTIPLPFRYNPIYRKIVFVIFVVVNAAALAMNAADMIYYRFTLRRTTLSVLGQFRNEQNPGGLILSFLFSYWYAVLCWVALVVLLIWVGRKIRYSGPQITNPVAFYISGTAILAFTVLLFIGGVRGGFAHSTRPITLSNAGEYAEVPNDINLVLNTPFAVIRTAGTAVIEKVNYFRDEQSLDKIFTPVHDSHPNGPFKYENVVVIILESFSMEFIGSYNHELDNGTYRGYAPFIDSLIGKSRAYQYSFANGRKSIDAMPSVISSIPSIEVPYVLSHYSGNKVNSMASLLREKGYTTSFFHGAPNGSMGFQAFARLTGFDHYYGKTEYNNDRDFDGIWGIWDEKFMQYFANEMAGMKQPFYTTLFSVSSHHPYNLPPGYDARFKGGPKIIHRTIQYTDYALREFFRTAKKMPWFKNTLFVFTADHASAEIQYKEYNTLAGYFSIPIFFYHGGEDWGSSKPEIIQQIDILPTVLGYLNYDKPYVAFGRNIFDADTEPFAFNYLNNTYQGFVGDYLLLFDGKRSTGLYAFKTDRMLQKNLLNERQQDVVVIERRLKALIQQYNNRMVEDDLTIEGPQRKVKR